VRDRIGSRFARLSHRQQLIVGMSVSLAMMLAIFAGVVLPLLLNNGPVAAEIAGRLPATAVSGRDLNVEIAINNTGDRLLSPVCLAVSSAPAVRVKQVVFQGIDTVVPSNGVACGGRLTTQETISVEIRILPGPPGNLDITISPTNGGAPIGPSLRGTVTVTSG